MLSKQKISVYKKKQRKAKHYKICSTILIKLRLFHANDCYELHCYNFTAIASHLFLYFTLKANKINQLQNKRTFIKIINDKQKKVLELITRFIKREEKKNPKPKVKKIKRKKLYLIYLRMGNIY